MQIRKKRAQAQINIVPMVDVLTVLIFFFLLTMQFKDIYAVDITPPIMKSSTAENIKMPNVLVVDKNGKYMLNAKKIDSSELKIEFEKIAKEKNPSVIVYADNQTPLKYVSDAIDCARLAKIKKLSLRAEQGK